MRYIYAVLALIVFLISIGAAGFYLRSGVVEDPGWHFDLPNPTKIPADYSWPQVVGSGTTMLVGIVFSYLYRRFSDMQAQKVENVNILLEIKGMLSATSFYLSLCAAPIVFCVVLAASRGATTLTALILAFQNGFFWQTVMPKSPPTTPQAGTGTLLQS